MAKYHDARNQPPQKSDQVRRVLDEIECQAAAAEYLEQLEARLRGRAQIRWAVAS